MRRALAVVMLLALPGIGWAAGGSTGFAPHAKNDVGNTASLQRGARNYVNYCLGCHSLQYVRYNRLAADLGIAEEDLAANLMWTADKPGEPMRIAMPSDDAARWFGRTPPDLSLISRSRGVDWVYGYLKAFYVDPDATHGYDNLFLEGLSMPHVLWQLEGDKKAIFEEVVDAEGNPHTQFARFEQVTAGTLSAGEYDTFVLDIVNFLDYTIKVSKGAINNPDNFSRLK